MEVTSVSRAAEKAQILLIFPLVIDWPIAHRRADSRVRFCTLGKEEGVANEIKQLLMSELGSRNTLHPSVEYSQVNACDVLFISSVDMPTFRELRDELNRMPVLTVGEGVEFLDEGGMIAFVRRVRDFGAFSKETIGFHINPTAIRARGLALDPMLLEIADRIVGEGV